MRSARHAWPALAAALLAACGGGDAPGGGDHDHAEVEWSSSSEALPGGGSRIVHAPPADVWAPTWVLEEELRIGSVDGGPAAFGEVRAIAVDAAGRVAVLDAMAQEVRVFAPDGLHLATHGRKGAGPGEFRNALGLMWDGEGRLLVPDPENGRMSVVDPVRGFVEAFPLTFYSYGFVWDGVRREDGHVLMPSVVPGSPRQVIRVLGPDMRQVDSILLPPRPEAAGDPPGAFAWEGRDGTSGFLQVPFFPQGVRLLLPSGELWSAEPGDPTIRVARWSPPGDTAVLVEVWRPLVPVSAAERDSAMESVLSLVRERGVQRLDASRVPRVKPGVLSLFSDDRGRLWINTSSPDSLRRYDVLEPDGRIAGAVATSLDVPRWFRPVVVGDRFYGVVTDELGVSYVVRARMVPSAGGG